MTDERTRPAIVKLADLMPKLDPEVVKALQANMQAVSRSIELAAAAMLKAAPDILANIASALPSMAAYECPQPGRPCFHTPRCNLEIGRRTRPSPYLRTLDA